MKTKLTPYETAFFPNLPEVLRIGGKHALLLSHCDLVEQVEALNVVVTQLWEQNNALREAAGLERVPLPLAGLRASAAGRWVGAGHEMAGPESREDAE